MRSLLLLAVAALCAAPLAAQSHTEGLFLHAAVGGQTVSYGGQDFDDTDEGGALAVRAGYGVSPVVTVYLGAVGGRMNGEREAERYALSAGELGARVAFRRGAALRPYLDVALRGVTARDDDTAFTLRGGGLAVGGGLAYFLSPSVALDAALHLGAGQITEVSFGRVTVGVRDEELDVVESRLTVGLTAYPFR